MEVNLVQTFLQEAEELLSEIERSCLVLEGGDPSGESIHQLFRAFHTIKGSSAMCGLDGVASFTHHVESLLDKIRNNELAISPTLSGLVLRSRDHIKNLLDVEHGGPAVPESHGARLIEEIEAASVSSPGGASPTPLQRGSEASKVQPQGDRTWSIDFRPNPDLLTRGSRPAALFKSLRAMGNCTVTAHEEAIPSLDQIQPDLCYLWWNITLEGNCDENAIRDVFIFVEDDAKLDIKCVAEPAHVTEPSEEVSSKPEEQVSAEPAGGPSSPATPARGTLAKESTVRVPANRLDRLVNLVGELVMNQSRLAQAASISGAAEFANPVQEMERLVAELRDNVLGIRMLPIGTLFGRYPRLVRDLSAQLGKEVELVTEGAETELDKSILDQLGDPLVHCLRNSIDHGVESPDERVSAGKRRRATIHLSAVHTGSDVMVSIQDDGRGINRAAVRAKAVERGLINADAVLSDSDIFNLILAPGFSTAAKVTNVSGRGVGMDAVKRNIDALRGTLSISSQEGKGTRISITLPLTLAIIEGLLVEVGCDQFIIPMSAVTENVELLNADRARNNGRNLIAVRGELIPYIDLRESFAVEGEAPQIEKVVIVQHDDSRVGLVVDRVVGTHQTVIQSLGKFFKNINVVSGATIMGDGRVALILDIAAVVRLNDGRKP